MLAMPSRSSVRPVTGMAEGVTAGRGDHTRTRPARTQHRLSTLFGEPDARARFGSWPYEPDVAHLVLLDHHMSPTAETINGWVTHAATQRSDLRAIRTGAMFPAAAEVFAAVGFKTIDTLTLLQARLDDRSTVRTSLGRRFTRSSGASVVPPAVQTHRLRAHHLPDVADLDRRSFGDPWGNDVRSLIHITEATPRHRARIVTTTDDRGRSMASGFAITGHAGGVGYLQRLAVDPATRRRGIARSLVDDSLRWMKRRGAHTAMVNTGFDNIAALHLYESAGFRPRVETLKILELSAPDIASIAKTR